MKAVKGVTRCVSLQGNGTCSRVGPTSVVTNYHVTQVVSHNLSSILLESKVLCSLMNLMLNHQSILSNLILLMEVLN
jgi:hypothetical protein